MEDQNSDRIVQAFALSADAAVAELGSKPVREQSTAEVTRRRPVHGENALRRREARSLLSMLFEQFRGILIWLLMGVPALSLGGRVSLSLPDKAARIAPKSDILDAIGG